MSELVPRIAFVVSHTHWDREWYLTFREFRVKLVRVVGEILDALERDPAFNHFLLDGQTVILEDHLAVSPEDAPRIRALAKRGALSLGPWYVLPDEFLVSGEALVRNLAIGHRVASRHGLPQKVGYMPDSFGHVAQMPQILRRAGIDSFVYTRGNDDEAESLGTEFVWRAPDGSEVLAVNQTGGYCNAGGLGFEEIWHAHTRREVDLGRAIGQVRELFEKMAPRSHGDVWLLNNGCDHFPPQRDLGLVLEALRAAFPSTEFRHASLGSYLEALGAERLELGRFEGELLGGKKQHILSGVWSARMPLKQWNDRCQSLLADALEPLCAYTSFLHGRAYPANAIESAWKLLLRNHPHDSICGCSIDEVHREMVPRFEGVARSAAELLRQELENLAPTFARKAEHDERTVLCVANPLPLPRTEVIERLLVLQPPGPDVDALRLFDERGRQVPFEIVDVRHVERFWGVDYRMELDAASQREKLDVYVRHHGARILRDENDRDRSDLYLTIRFAAELPSLGHALFFLRDAGGDVAICPEGVSLTGSDTLENALLKIRLSPDGRFDLEDKTGGAVYRGLNLLESTEDVGDEYDYCPAARTQTVTSAGAQGSVRAVAGGGLRGVLQADLLLALPAAIADDRSGRLDERVECPVSVRVGLSAASPVVDVELRFDNRARDHRLRAWFPAGFRTAEIVSDGHFMIHRRPGRRAGGEDWLQPPPSTWPQQEFSLLEGDGRGLAVFNRGLPEIEAADDGDGTSLVLTLLRSVEWLSRDDLATRRRQNAGPTLHTPDAQCAGLHRFHYAVMPVHGDSTAVDVKQHSRRYRVAPLCVQGVEDLCVPGGRGLLAVSDHRICVSAVKKHETRDSLVVRAYNLTAGQVAGTLLVGFDATSVSRLDLLEERIGEPAVSPGRELPVLLGPHEIVTLELVFG